MPVFVSTTYVENGTSVVEPVQQLVAAGITGIELGSIHRAEPDLLDRLAAFEGVRFLTHNFFPPDDSRLVINLASASRETRRASIDFAKRAIDFAVSLGADVYTLHPGFAADPAGESNARGRNFDFRFDDAVNHDAMAYCIESLDEVWRHAAGKPLRVAIETQGSVTSRDQVLLCRPHEYEALLAAGGDACWFNLNLAHSQLAAAAHGFELDALLALIKSRVVAVEVSHNDGSGDQHLDLVEDGWYLEVLADETMEGIPVIFEGRRIAFDRVLQSVEILKRVVGE